ncbi:hypothetical protein PVK06_028405 [Gossypium arboreum]|uniref:Uncharacterized protein n=1 Tax=Gossypium arboreum TaxID=29729 RepID=A0ABR0P2W3_GOSAR|nr:hypothetical protein PVK06_028405 [Gossypium arboreum]
MAQRPQMDISFDLQPSLEYIQWYSSTRNSYLLGEQLTVVPPHMHRLGAYEPVPEIEAEPEPELEPEPEPEPEPERSHTHSGDSSYHLELRVNDYFLGSSGHRYHFGFDIFSPVPTQYSTPLIHRITPLLLRRIYRSTTLLPA